MHLPSRQIAHGRRRQPVPTMAQIKGSGRFLVTASWAALLVTLHLLLAPQMAHASEETFPKVPIAKPSGSICPRAVPKNDAEPRKWQKWSSPSTWPNRIVPGVGQGIGAVATIACGQNVLFDIPHTARKPLVLSFLNITGVLKIWDVGTVRDVVIHTNHVLVQGRFIIGHEKRQQRNKVKIYLTADKINRRELAVNGKFYGRKAFVVLGGRVSFHGMPTSSRSPSWVRLAAPARAGENTIITDASVLLWPIGARLALASSDCTHKHAEQSFIKSIRRHGAGSMVTLSTKLMYNHWGGSVSSNGLAIDASAEVAMLTRNIVIEGEKEKGDYALEGGHFGIFFTTTPQAVEGVEYVNMGQQGNLGRYPIHFHFMRAAPKTYVRKCAVRESNQRCIVVHATDFMTVQDNVAFNASGHCFITEDGFEVGNKFIGNLGFSITAVTKILPSGMPDDGPGFPKNDKQPATFWMANPNNTLMHNAAAGGMGPGFWFNAQKYVNGPSYSLPGASSYSPQKAPFGFFDTNVAHSTVLGFNTYPQYTPDPTGGVETADPANTPSYMISNFKAYRCCGQGGMAFTNGRRLIVDKAVLFENKLGVEVARAGGVMVQNSLIVGKTDTPAFANYMDVFESNIGVQFGINYFPMMDYIGVAPHYGAPRVVNTRFNGYYPELSNAAAIVQGCTLTCQANTVAKAGQGVDGITFGPRTVALRVDPQGADLLHDVSGSIIGAPGFIVNTNSKHLWRPACKLSAAVPNAYFCPGVCYKSILLQVMGADASKIRLVRDDTGKTVPTASYHNGTVMYWNQIDGISYSLSFPTDPTWFAIQATNSGCGGRASLSLRTQDPYLNYTFKMAPNAFPRPCDGVDKSTDLTVSYYHTECNDDGSTNWVFDLGNNSPSMKGQTVSPSTTPTCTGIYSSC